MQIEKSFVVDAGVEAVWAFLIDPHRVARCLPGAAITGQVDARTYSGTITVKVGPVQSRYQGKVVFERLDSEAREADLAASGQEVRGKGGARMKMQSRLVEKGPSRTEVTVVSDLVVMGILAQMGRGMIQDVGDQLFDRFTAAMRQELAAEAAAGRAPSGVAEAAASTAAGSGSERSPSTAAAPGEAAAPIAGPTAAPRAASQPQPVAEPIQVLTFGPKIAARALGRALKRPGFWIGVLVLAAIAVGLWLALR